MSSRRQFFTQLTAGIVATLAIPKAIEAALAQTPPPLVNGHRYVCVHGGSSVTNLAPPTEPAITKADLDAWVFNGTRWVDYPPQAPHQRGDMYCDIFTMKIYQYDGEHWLEMMTADWAHNRGYKVGDVIEFHSVGGVAKR